MKGFTVIPAEKVKQLINEYLSENFDLLNPEFQTHNIKISFDIPNQNGWDIGDGVVIDPNKPITDNLGIKSSLIDAIKKINDGQTNNTIRLIKNIRTQTGLGLKEAKEVVDKHLPEWKQIIKGI